MVKDTQEIIIENTGNIIIKAGAGRGKTTLLAKKIKYDYENNKDHRVYAAITFTNKAVEEIKNRLRTVQGVVQTIDSFIMQEIIVPFINHAYGDEYKKKNLERDFSLKFKEYNDFLQSIKENSKVGTNKLIKEDFLSKLALNILEKSLVAQRYFTSKYYRIYIDEYQDVTKEQHDLFYYINNNLAIKLFVLGDINQNIYSWRGSSINGFNYFYENRNFTQYELKTNYRCHSNIQKFLEIFEKNDTSHLDFDYGNNVVFLFNSKDLVEVIKENKDKCICILRRNQGDAKDITEKLKKINDIPNFEYIPLDGLSSYNSDYKWFTKEFLHFILSEDSNIFKLISIIPIEGSTKILRKLKDELKKFKITSINLFNDINKIYQIIFPEIKEDEYKKEYQIIDQIIKNKTGHILYNMRKVKNICMTMHSSKGLEFDMVIVWGEELLNYGIIEDNLNYVSMSRGKEKLIIYVEKDGEYLKKIYKRLSSSQKIKFLDLNIAKNRK